MRGLCRVLLTAALFAAVLGCQSAPLRSGVLSHAEAVARARVAASGRIDGVASAWLGPFGAIEIAPTVPNIDPNRLIWEVVLNGSFAGSCASTEPGASRQCPAPAQRATVVVDARSGEIVITVFSG